MLARSTIARGYDRAVAREPTNFTGEIMNRLIYIVGLVVVVLAVLYFFGLR